MELRVWVDGVQRVVCGVRLTTTCQEIVFVLAKATHQAGRFTMIERWRNNERLLSPNEQPLVTLQRWGEHMNEVEFFLNKASSDIQTQPNQVSQQQQQNRAIQLPNHLTTNNNHDNNNNARSQQQQPQQQIMGGSSSNMRSSPARSPMQSLRNNQPQFMDPLPSSYTHNQYNLNRRPQTSLGPLTSSSSALGIGLMNYSPQQQLQQTSNLHPMVMRNSLSTSTLPDLPKPINGQNQANNNILSANARYIEEQLMNSSPSSLYGPLHNGYSTRGETSNAQHYFNNLQQADQQVQQHQQQQQQQQQATKNHPFEELYSTINKKRIHNPPAVPAKPRLAVPMTSMANYPLYHNNTRPRHPPGYSDYLEAIASRNSAGQSVIPSSTYVSHNNQPIPHSNNSVRSRLGESGLVINLGSAVNVKLHPSNLSSNQTLTQDDLQRSTDLQRSVSEIGHDMLKMIEEQKKVLLNQKDELDRLDNDRDYWETKQNSEQVELVNRIENEIHQLEELWRENQAQISKLEYQDLEREVQDLKSEQVRIEVEITQQKNKLVRCEDRITSCKSQIDRLELELATFIDSSTSDSSAASNGVEATTGASAIKKHDSVEDPVDSTESTNTSTNGTTSSSDNNCVSRSSDGEDDLEDDSDGDYSDDLNSATSELKLRAAKDVAYVDKRGLISGIRSFKLDKSRAALSSKQPSEHNRFSNNSITDLTIPDSLDAKDKNCTTSTNNNNVNNGCLETNVQYSAKTATSSNQYEFLMTL